MLVPLRRKSIWPASSETRLTVDCKKVELGPADPILLQVKKAIRPKESLKRLQKATAPKLLTSKEELLEVIGKLSLRVSMRKRDLNKEKNYRWLNPNSQFTPIKNRENWIRMNQKNHLKWVHKILNAVIRNTFMPQRKTSQTLPASILKCKQRHKREK